MEIDGELLEVIISNLQNYDSFRKAQRLIETGCELNPSASMFYHRTKARIKDLQLLQLTEEKRRLLTCIIEWMNAVCSCGFKYQECYASWKICEKIMPPRFFFSGIKQAS